MLRTALEGLSTVGGLGPSTAASFAEANMTSWDAIIRVTCARDTRSVMGSKAPWTLDVHTFSGVHRQLMLRRYSSTFSRSAAVRSEL